MVPIDDRSVFTLPLSVKSGQPHRCRSGCARPRSPLAPRCVHMRARKSPHHGVAVFCMPLSSPNGAGSSPEPATEVPRGDCPDEGRDHRRPVNGVGMSRRRARGLQAVRGRRRGGPPPRRVASTCGHAERRRFPAGSWSSRPALGTSCAPVRLAPAIDARAPRPGITAAKTGYASHPTVQHTRALILGAARYPPVEANLHPPGRSASPGRHGASP